MFDQFRHPPTSGETGAPVLTTEQTTVPTWLRRPVVGRYTDRNLPNHLDREMSGMGAVLKDVRLPAMAHSLDHLVVAPSGVWLIDTVHLSGRLTRTDVGTRHNPNYRLSINGIDRTSIVDELGILRQARHAIAAMQLGVEVQTAMCLIDTSWPLSARPFQVRDHWITWPRALTDKIRSSGLVPIRTAHEIAERIAAHQVIDSAEVASDSVDDLQVTVS